jgi:hypothetical protein
MTDLGVIKLNSVFFGIFDLIQNNYSTRQLAYEAAEEIFGQRCITAFGEKMRKFSDYDVFLASYNRATRNNIKNNSNSCSKLANIFYTDTI